MIGAAAAVDIYERRVPNIICLCALLPAFVRAVLAAAEVFTGNALPSPANMAFGAALALLVMLIPYAIKKSFGAGDVKLMIVCGLYAGLRGCAVIVFISFTFCAFSMLIYMALKRRRIHTAPFAPFIFAGTVYFLFSAYLS